MKGDVSPAIYVIIALIVGIVILAVLFMLGLGPFSKEGSASLCKSQILKACGKYETSGKIEAFREVPSTCANILGDKSHVFNGCINDNSLLCDELCKWIKLGG